MHSKLPIVQGINHTMKPKYTFSQLISSVDDLKKKFESLKSENLQLKENMDNILKQVLNMESQLISNGCMLEKFQIVNSDVLKESDNNKVDDTFDLLLKNSLTPKTAKLKQLECSDQLTFSDASSSSPVKLKRKRNNSSESLDRESKNIKVEENHQLNIKEEVDDDEYQELEEEACSDAGDRFNDKPCVEFSNSLKIETDETQANIFDLKSVGDCKDESSYENYDSNEEDIHTSSLESDSDDAKGPKEYSLKRLHMDLVEYLDKNEKRHKEKQIKKRRSDSRKNKVYCVCKSHYKSDKPMIGCDGPCKDWYHFKCVGIPEDFRSIAEWYCENCFLDITGGSRDVCLCGGTFESAHELIRCRGRCKKLYHPGCLGLDNEEMVERWDAEGRGHCGFCNS